MPSAGEVTYDYVLASSPPTMSSVVLLVLCVLRMLIHLDEAKLDIPIRMPRDQRETAPAPVSAGHTLTNRCRGDIVVLLVFR